MAVEALGYGVSLNVQRTVLNAAVAIAEARLGLGEEARGNVGVGVFEPTRGKLGKHGRGGRPRTGPDFNHSKSSIVGQGGDEGLDRVGQHSVGGAGNGGLQVKIGRRWFAAAE